MRHPWLRILVLAHACWWFGFYAPAHQRGAIPITGDAAATPQTGSCCSSPSCETPEEPADPRGEDPSRRCAVCFLVAKLDVPIVLDWALRPLGLVDLLPAREPVVFVGDNCESTYLGRAPPASFIS